MVSGCGGSSIRRERVEFTAEITAGPEVISAVNCTWLSHPWVLEVGVVAEITAEKGPERY